MGGPHNTWNQTQGHIYVDVEGPIYKWQRLQNTPEKVFQILYEYIYIIPTKYYKSRNVCGETHI